MPRPGPNNHHHLGSDHHHHHPSSSTVVAESRRCLIKEQIFSLEDRTSFDPEKRPPSPSSEDVSNSLAVENDTVKKKTRSSLRHQTPLDDSPSASTVIAASDANAFVESGRELIRTVKPIPCVESSDVDDSSTQPLPPSSSPLSSTSRRRSSCGFPGANHVASLRGKYRVIGITDVMITREADTISMIEARHCVPALGHFSHLQTCLWYFWGSTLSLYRCQSLSITITIHHCLKLFTCMSINN